MKLLLPKVLDHLTNKAIVCCDLTGPYSLRRAHSSAVALAPQIERAGKFIFDSGTDNDPDFVGAVRETALEMMQAGLFHLPHPVTWIEDPFESEPDERHFYFCVEHGARIEVRMFHGANLGPRGPWLSVIEPRIEIDLAEPRHTFALNGVEIPLTVAEPSAYPERFHVKRKCGEAVYALKKFLVTLTTGQAVTERVDRKKSAGSPKRFRDYPHTIIRVPLDEISGHTDLGAARPKRRKHLVRGYTWGKNTRPLEEQRWIAPFFRGSAELGEVSRSHTVVG